MNKDLGQLFCTEICTLWFFIIAVFLQPSESPKSCQYEPYRSVEKEKEVFIIQNISQKGLSSESEPWFWRNRRPPTVRNVLHRMAASPITLFQQLPSIAVQNHFIQVSTIRTKKGDFRWCHLCRIWIVTNKPWFCRNMRILLLFQQFLHHAISFAESLQKLWNQPISSISGS